MIAAIFSLIVRGVSSGTSVSSTVGMPVTKSISSGFHTFFRFMSLYPIQSTKKSGMLMSIGG